MKRITLIPGDGTGPEISAATARVIDAADIGIVWDVQNAGADVMEEFGTPLPQHVLDSVLENGVAIKGPLTTPIGTGFRSINVTLRRELDLYANLRPARSIVGVKAPYEDIDLVVVRENMEDLYSGVERMVEPDHAESIKIITRAASERIAHFAFQYAVREGRKKVTAVHKANILKFTDGLFLDCARRVAAEYPQIEFEDRIVDNMAMQLVQKPHIYDVLLCPNLYGDILSDLCAGLVGGLGVAPSGNMGDSIAVFEPVHGSAPKYKGMNKVNPTAMILSGALMLRYLGEERAADLIYEATAAVIGEGKTVTYDLGGDAGTSEMADAIVAKMESLRR
ncbi:MAG: isocitrate/isopropylmalate dehydrogenase family protein [Candidatus Geothermincolia bacterium]